MKLPSARKLFLFLATFSLINLYGLVSFANAEGTRTWEQSKFDELTKGTAIGVAIRNSGGLELAPTFKSVYATPSTYIWAIAADDSGTVYAAAGAPRMEPPIRAGACAVACIVFAERSCAGAISHDYRR